MKVRKQFDLENVQFAEESDDEDNLICNQLIEMYNKEYSFMLSETKNFFADCKDFITRFMTINNMGIGFNLPFMLNAFLKIESETVSPTKTKKQKISWNQKAKQFQQNFAGILNKMGEVIEQLLDFQIKIKTAYLGSAFSSPTKLKTRLNIPKNKNKAFYIGNYLNSYQESNKLLSLENDQNPQQQKILRTILQKGMMPSNKNQAIVCNTKLSPLQNIDRLANKIDNLKFQIQFSKQKEQKIWKNFNEKRHSKNFQDQKQDYQQDQQYKQINNMLSDMISIKNRKFSKSPFQTGESSVR